MRRRLALLGLCGSLALSAGLVSLRRVGDQIAVLDACEAAAAGDWAAALAGTRGRVGPDETGRAAAECRCRALLAHDRADACVALLEDLLAQPEADGWAPSPALSIHLIQTRRDAGRALEAAELARRAARLYPADPDLFYLELVTRSAVEEEPEVLRELALRVPERGPQAARMRVSLANRYLLRGETERALEILGGEPPRDAEASLGLWFETRGMAFASAGDLEGLRRNYTLWRQMGGEPQELLARYALTLSIGKLSDPREPTLSLLTRALRQPLADPKLEEALTIRLILGLVAAERIDDAIALYDEARARFALEGLSRDELARSAAQLRLADTAPAQRIGRLRFEVASPPAGARLLLSPSPELPVDTPYAERRLPPSGVLTLEAQLDTAPQRWVLRDDRDFVLASGSAQVASGALRDVQVRPGAPRRPERAALTRLPADGRRRVALLLLDCGDWRIAQYLRTRGELPVLSALLEDGYRAVLYSDPPLTAAALEALVWPQRRVDASFVGLVHRLGVELAGLSSVGDNPFSALSWLLPETPDLFSSIGAGSRTAANLLFAHGGIHAGRHGELTGPHGRRHRVSLGTSARDLDADERQRFPALAAVHREQDAVHLRSIAAEFDATEELLRAGEVDFLAVRIEALDILTHAHFAEAVRDGQDDGRGLLFSVYRYIDARLEGVSALLDADDVLVVMSDHGIRTAMEHSPFALFVASGDGVPRGRAADLPALRGVARAVADWLGIPTDWPGYGVAPWARALAPPLAAASAPPHPADRNR